MLGVKHFTHEETEAERGCVSSLVPPKFPVSQEGFFPLLYSIV